MYSKSKKRKKSLQWTSITQILLWRFSCSCFITSAPLSFHPSFQLIFVMHFKSSDISICLSKYLNIYIIRDLFLILLAFLGKIHIQWNAQLLNTLNQCIHLCNPNSYQDVKHSHLPSSFFLAWVLASLAPTSHCYFHDRSWRVGTVGSHLWPHYQSGAHLLSFQC